MGKSIRKRYYCMVKIHKAGDYDLISHEGTNYIKVMKEVKFQGYRVLIALSKEQIDKLQSLKPYELFEAYPNWSIEAYKFLKSIDDNMLRTCIKL